MVIFAGDFFSADRMQRGGKADAALLRTYVVNFLVSRQPHRLISLSSMCCIHVRGFTDE
jgi:hypothetical protein